MNYSLCNQLQEYLSALRRGYALPAQISEAKAELDDLHVVSEEEYVGTLYTESQYVRMHTSITSPEKPKMEMSSFLWFFISIIVFAVCICIYEFKIHGILYIVATLLMFPSLISCVINGLRIIVSTIMNIPKLIAYSKSLSKYQSEQRKAREGYLQYRAECEAKQRRRRAEYRSNPARFEQEFFEKTANIQDRITQLNEEEKMVAQKRRRLENELGIPSRYNDTTSLERLVNIINDGRADSLKEAINVYESDKEMQKQTDYAKKLAEYAQAQAMIQYERMKQEQDSSQQVAAIISQLHDEAAQANRKDGKRRGVEQCYNCKRYLTCSQRYNNDTGMCTGFLPTEKYLI